MRFFVQFSTPTTFAVRPQSPRNQPKTSPTLITPCYCPRTPQTSEVLPVLLIVSAPVSLLALVAAPLAAQAFEVVTPTQWLANTTVTVNWTSVTTDPEVFSIEVRPETSVLQQQQLTNGLFAFHIVIPPSRRSCPCFRAVFP